MGLECMDRWKAMRPARDRPGHGQRRDRAGDLQKARAATRTSMPSTAAPMRSRWRKPTPCAWALPVRFAQADWLDGAGGGYDLIASNPPYIAAGDPHLPALRHEPVSALVAGADGLDDIRRIVHDAPPTSARAAGCCWNTATTRPRPCASCSPSAALPRCKAATTLPASRAAPAESGAR
jgi:hypothetical protein